MSNYLNNVNYAVEPTKSESRYSIHEEDKQNQWINQIAKQAAKLISEQIEISDSCSSKTSV